MHTYNILRISILAALTLVSCANDNELEVYKTELNISVRTTSQTDTKAPIFGNSLPSNSEIGISVVDATGVTYDNTEILNRKYSSIGEENEQIWTTDNKTALSSTNGTLYSYYPYKQEHNGFVIPITSDINNQTDWMWAEPMAVNENKANIQITLKHALSLFKVKIKRGDYTGTGEITSINISSKAMATDASLDIRDGSLNSISGQDDDFNKEIQNTTISDESQIFDVLFIPTSQEHPVTLNLIIDGQIFIAETEPMKFTQGEITVLEIKVNSSSLLMTNIKVTPWSSGQTIYQESSTPKITFHGEYDKIDFQKNEVNGIYTITAIPKYPHHIVNEITIEGDTNYSQEIDENGILTIILSQVTSDIRITFSGTTFKFKEWARIQHMDGTLYTAEEWLEAESAGIVTDDDALGVAVLFSRFAECPHIISKEYHNSSIVWTNDTAIDIPGVHITQSNDINDQNSCLYDTGGKENTAAINSAVESGLLVDAQAAQMCLLATILGGIEAYIPAVGEVIAWLDNKTEIDKCLEAIGGKLIDDTSGIDGNTESSGFMAMTSTLYDNNSYWYAAQNVFKDLIDMGYSYEDIESMTGYKIYFIDENKDYVLVNIPLNATMPLRPVITFEYDQNNEYHNKINQ